jgi:hypothetical protein
MILLQLHSAYELYLATTEDGKRPEKDTGPRDPDESEESEDDDGQDRQSTMSRKAGCFRQKRKAPVKPLTLSKRFKRTLSQPQVKVHFVGAWCVRHVAIGKNAL